MKTMGRTRQVRLTRTEAAAMLRAARAASPCDPDRRGEIIGWALSAIPESLPARRLKIDFLHEHGHADAANALIARCLMQGRGRAAGPMMRLRLARSLHSQERLDAADREICRVLADRPEHRGALVLGARIARDLDRPLDAVGLLIRAIDGQSGRDDLRSMLVDALLEAGLVERASAELSRLGNPPPVLTARVLRAQHRVLEAVEVLELAVNGSHNHDSSASAMIELIGALEELGDPARLRTQLNRAGHHQSPALLRAAKAMLAHGLPNEAANVCTMLLGQPKARREALRLLLAAQVSLGCSTDASETLEQIAGMNPPIAIDAMASIWLAAMRGELLHSIESPRTAGRDPIMSLLQPMLRRAVEVFQLRIDADESLTKVNEDVLGEHLAVCRGALGEAGPATTLRPASAVTLSRKDRQPAGDSIAKPAPLRRAA